MPTHDRLVATWPTIAIYAAKARKSQSSDPHETEKPFRWEDIDQRLLAPKINALVEEMLKRSTDMEHEIDSDTSLSRNSALIRWLDSKKELADEYAERSYAAHCEAWSQQNRTISPRFIRGVWSNDISKIFAAQKTSVVSSIAFKVLREESVNSGALEEWQRAMDRLANRRGSDLEAEAVAIEYAAEKAKAIRLELAATASEQSTTAPLGRPNKSSFRKVRPRGVQDERRCYAIWTAIKMGLRGKKYRESLDKHNLRLKDCPTTYAVASRLPKWAHKINQEKSRMKVAMNKMEKDHPVEFMRIMRVREAKVS
jgi:hypothetical protein